MINPVTKGFWANLNLDDIIEPVKFELGTFEKKISKELSGSTKLLDDICDHIIKSGGKRLRPAVTFLLAKALNRGLLSSDHFKLGIALELIHTASLIHDDVIDGTDVRRNSQTVHNKWNEKLAVISGDFLLAKSLKKLAEIKNLQIIELFANIMNEICVGEAEQGEQSYQIISLEEYIRKSIRKTAMLFVAGCEGAALITPGADNEMVKSAREYALNLGIAFQIFDDILNFSENQNTTGKPVGVDLKNGIITAPALFAIKEYEKSKDYTLRTLIQNKFKTDEEYNQAVRLVLDSNGIQKAKELSGQYVLKAVKCLDSVQKSIYRDSLVNIAYYSANRHF